MLYPIIFYILFCNPIIKCEKQSFFAKNKTRTEIFSTGMVPLLFPDGNGKTDGSFYAGHTLNAKRCLCIICKLKAFI